VYCSEQAHSSIDKAAVVLGLGRQAVKKVAVDDEFRMRPDHLAAEIAADRRTGNLPVAVVATAGTTSTTSIDPVEAIADVCEREQLWLHVDAAYAGAAAIVPDYAWILDGVARADSVVVNPHKWLFTPLDLSALYCRRFDTLRRAFAVTPEYLRTGQAPRVRNMMDTGISLSRRFRALKLWMVLRYFGADGLRARITNHIQLASKFAHWVDEHPDFERLAPVSLSVVCFRAVPQGLELNPAALDTFNCDLLGKVNASGEVFLSPTRLNGRYALRLAVGHLRTGERHVRGAWEIICASLEAMVRRVA
jgi:aromatic-L-amino-acid decarboxylase